MRKIFLFCFLGFGFAAHAQEIDVLHYSFVVELKDNSDTITGSATIIFTRKANVSNVSFDLANVKQNGKGMKVLAVNTLKSKVIKYSFSQSDDKLNIQLPPYKQNDTCNLTIVYSGIPDDGLIISKNKYGNRTFFADNWPNRAHHWLPCNDRPDDKASFEFILAVPSHYDVVSNGKISYERNDMSKLEGLAPEGMLLWHWKEDIPSPTKVMVIGVAKFATKTFEDSPKNIPVSAWVYPQDSTKGFYDYALSTDILKYFSDYIAPFPYNKLANVQSKTIFGGMENASCIFYDENSVTGDRTNEDLLAHEIAHQWFGDMTTEKSFAHLWLSEGFATYFTDLYFEHKYGREAFLKRLKKERTEAIAFAKSSSHPVVDTTSNLMSLLNANSYQKGAWVLHMLREEVGDSVFHKIIQTYYNGYKGSNADTRDFEAIAEKVSGKDLKPFFDQWLYTAGVPKLSVQKTINEKGVYVKVEQLQPKLYRLALPVAVEASNTKEKIVYFEMKDRTQTFFLSNDKSAKLTVDPNSTLLYEEAK